jgi:hypothetical protein
MSANLIWGKKYEKGKRKRGKCEGKRRKDTGKGEIEIKGIK